MKRRLLALAMAVASLSMTSGSALATVPGDGVRPADAAPVGPSVTMSYMAPSVPVGGTATLQFNVGNPNPSYKLDQVKFDVLLPVGLVIATPSHLYTACVSKGSGITASGNVVIVNYLFFDYYGSCSITVDVRAITSGAQSGSTTDLTGCVFCPTPVLTGTATTASIAVLANPVIAAEILPATIAAGGSSHVTFGIPTRTGTVGL